MITTAIVVETDGKRAVVEAERKSACEGCHKTADGASCGACLILGGNRKIRATAANNVGAVVGDTVEIQSSSGKMLLYSALIFLLPVLVAAAAYFIAASRGLGEGASGLCAVGGLVAAFVAVFVISKSVAKKGCDVEIVKIIK